MTVMLPNNYYQFCEETLEMTQDTSRVIEWYGLYYPNLDLIENKILVAMELHYEVLGNTASESNSFKSLPEYGFYGNMTERKGGTVLGNRIPIEFREGIIQWDFSSNLHLKFLSDCHLATQEVLDLIPFLDLRAKRFPKFKSPLLNQLAFHLGNKFQIKLRMKYFTVPNESFYNNESVPGGDSCFYPHGTVPTPGRKGSTERTTLNEAYDGDDDAGETYKPPPRAMPGEFTLTVGLFFLNAPTASATKVVGGIPGFQDSGIREDFVRLDGQMIMRVVIEDVTYTLWQQSNDESVEYRLISSAFNPA